MFMLPPNVSFQDYATVRSIIVWFDANMANYSIDDEKVLPQKNILTMCYNI